MNIVTTLLVGAFVFGTPVFSKGGAKVQEAQSQTVIVVVGAAGAPEYAAQFGEWAGLWREACAKGGARFIAVGLDEEQEPSDRLRLQKTLSDESGQTASALWLVLIGHGTFDGRTAKFNLRGPDVSADELAEWLKLIVRPVAVINTASSSAPFLKKLSGPGRVVVTATKSGFEHNYARFGQYLARAIIEPGADLDKDGQTSLLEAFLTASAGVKEFYSAAGRLATEHALLDDNGDTLGTPADWFRGIRPVRKAADDASLDGYRAHQLHILSSEAEAAMAPELRARRDSLELEVMRLRDTKEALSEDEYYGRLESLLRQIAEIYSQSEMRE
ncbi:MAG: hypothetical protein JSU94_14070 [Phycisphaerales bacterium]|nr:MAG: hypothetical protein JSU94_14070 [Phycisphaerales bacterium]